MSAIRIILGMILLGAILLPQSVQAANPNAVAYSTVTVSGGKVSGTIGKVACFASTRQTTARNILGAPLFAYAQKVSWCSNAGKITGTVSKTRWATVYGSYWEFRGHVEGSTSGGTASQTAFTQGSFAGCVPLVPTACVYRYPYISQTVLPSGLTYGYNGG